MSDRQILASPNWYCSGISDISVDGLFAFGGKNTIFLLDLTAGHECCDYFGQLCGHKERVTSLNFCKTSAYSRCIVSSADDLSVIIWDVDAKASISKHNRHQAKITTVYWSQVSPEWIFSGDEKGHIFSWNHQRNEVYEYVPLTGHMNCISCSPDEDGLVVAGYKTGQILVLLLQKEKQEIVHVLKGHNDEVHSLVWSPVPASELPEEITDVPKGQESGHVLASGSRDNTIRFWDISVGEFTAVLHVPAKTSNKKTSREDHHVKSRLWNTLCWPQTDPNSLISSGFNGDILAWNLSKKSKQKWELFSDGNHSRIVFNICYYASNDVMVSVSMDRLINIWSRHDARVITSLPSCGGFVYSLDLSVLDPSRLAIGVGDNMIRIWETMTDGTSYNVTYLWRGIGTKVMKVLWHPVKESVLAFGTEEGKVGIYNVMSQTCNISRTYHKKSVYSLSWGPPSGSSGDESEGGMIWHLYSCGGEGTIFEHKPSHLQEVANNIDQLIKTTNGIKHNLAGHSEVSSKPDRSLMAVGNEDGSIKFYRFPDLKLLATINVHNKSITCLSWCRDHDTNDPASTFLASGSNDPEVHVHDVKHITDGVDKGEQKVFTSSYRWLSGHGGRVTNVVWSPHSFSKLASSSYDGTVEVWDVLKGEPLVNYRGHTGRVMTVAWSLMDPDVLYSGGDDFTARSWRISQQVFKQPPVDVKKPARQKLKKKKKKTSSANQKTEILPAVSSESLLEENDTVRDEKEPIEPDMDEGIQHSAKLMSSESTDTLERKSFQLVSSATERNQDTQNNVSIAEEHSVGAKALVELKRKKKKGKSMFPLAASADNKTRSITSQECVDVAKLLASTEGYSEDILHISGENINLGLFADRKSAFNMLSEEGIHHAENGNMDYQLQLEVWKGNVGKALEIAVEKKQLCDWLVAISSLAGERVRLAVTEAFAEQLVYQGSYHRAALYYLACHKVYEAIRMFKTAGMYREAISLAKVRLLPSDPLLLDLYSSWGRKLESDHSYELASKCYLACGLHEDAIRVLTRRGDEIALHSAAQIAKLSKKIELSESLILQCAMMAVKKAKWKDALEMVHDYPDMQPFLMLMFAHKTILVSLLKSEVIVSENFPEIQDSDDPGHLDVKSNLPKSILQLKAKYETRSSDSTSYWGSTAVDGSYSVCKILERWSLHCALHGNEAKLPGVYVQIAAMGCNQNLSNKDDIGNILMIISKNICLGLVAALLAKPDICMEHFLKAVVHCHDSGYFKLLRHLVMLLFPFGLESWYMVKCLSESHRGSTSSFEDQYFCNIMAFYYRALLTDTLTSRKLKVTQKVDLEESQQIGFSKDANHCPSANRKEPNNRLLNMNNVTSNAGQNSENAESLHKSDEYSQESSNAQSVSGLDFTLAKNHAEREDNSTHDEKLEETSFKEIHRIALVCSTVLLSDIHAQFQTVNGNIKTYVPEEGGYAQHGGSAEKTEMEISLSKIPFPNVMESASMLVDLMNYIVLSKKTRELDKIIALELSWQVRHWADARGCNKEQGEFSRVHLENVNDSKQQ